MGPGSIEKEVTIKDWVLKTDKINPEISHFADKIQKASFSLQILSSKKLPHIVVRGLVRYPHITKAYQEELVDLYLSKDVEFFDKELERGALLGKPASTLSVGELLALRWYRKQASL